MSAAGLKMAVEAVGGRLRADGAELVVAAPKGRLGPELVAELRDRKAQVLAVLRGETCRYCGEHLDYRADWGTRVFADGTGAHGVCYSVAAAERAVLSPDALADEADLVARGEPLP